MVQIDTTAIEKILEVGKRLDEKQVVNGYEGNISLKQDGLIYITPSGKNKAYLTSDMVAVTDLDGNQVWGKFKASSELPMHVNLYKMNPEIGGVVHTHDPYLTAFSCCAHPIENMAYGGFIWDNKVIEIAPYGRPGSDELWKGLEPIVKKGRQSALLANHGPVTWGKDVFEAMNKMEAIGNDAKILLFTKIIGNLDVLPEDEIEALMNM